MNKSAPIANKATRESILTAVANTILKNRQDIYGPPEDSFAAIADLWTVYLSRHAPGPLHSHDVAAMMALLKIARIMAQPTHMDNWIDLTGYGACGGELSSLFAALQNTSKAQDPFPVATEERSENLSQDEAMEANDIARQLYSHKHHKWWADNITNTIMDGILRPITLKFSDLNTLRNLVKHQ